MKLKRVYIEITNLCNLKCSFCPPCSRSGRFMTEDEFERVLQQVAPYHPHIYLHVKGEPLLHPKLEQLLLIASHYNLPVNLTTNGTLLGGCSDMLLKSSSLRQVNFSVHSLESQDEGAETEYLAALACFGVAAAEKGHPFVTYRMWNGAQGIGISPVALRQLQALAAPFYQNINAALPKGRNAAKLSANVYVSFMEQFVWPSLALPSVSVQGKCLGGREMLAVLADGTVVPCCLDGEGNIPLGNLFTQELSSILKGPRYTALQNGFSGGQISEELCRRCSYRQRFDKK